MGVEQLSGFGPAADYGVIAAFSRAHAESLGVISQMMADGRLGPEDRHLLRDVRRALKEQQAQACRLLALIDAEVLSESA